MLSRSSRGSEKKLVTWSLDSAVFLDGLGAMVGGGAVLQCDEVGCKVSEPDATLKSE